MHSKMTTKELINTFKENYVKVRKLLDEDSKNDPENDPYHSKYKAKDLLNNMLITLDNVSLENIATDFDPLIMDSMIGTVLVNIGVINMETEELTASEQILTRAEKLLSTNASKPEIIITLLNVYNNLGVLWSNRDVPEKAKTYLVQAKECYESFKCTLQMPIPIEHIVAGSEENPVGDLMLLEKAHTLTCYYLAQVFGSLKENLKSAIYCHFTLRRQLQYSDYEPIDWALNSATLSQFFAEQSGFFQSRHHLAAATTILEQYEKDLTASPSEEETYLAKLETFKHRSADVARCWAKYCLILLSSSRQRLLSDSDQLPEAITDMSNLQLEDDENICGGDIKSLVFPDFDVSNAENKVTDKFLLTYDDARKVFLFCQECLNKAKDYYKLETLASDYIELIQDSSQSYNHLLFFEEDDERRAKMHKRRINILEDLVKEINPTYYLQYCRQLWYELGEVYSEILDIKLERMNAMKEKPTPHVLMKINLLCEKSIENYDNFLDSVKNKNKVIPDKLDDDLIRPVVSALAFIGRNSMKRIALDKSMQLDHVNKSLQCYQEVVNICTKNKNAAAMMAEEFSLCQEMVNILPLKILKLKAEGLAA